MVWGAIDCGGNESSSGPAAADVLVTRDHAEIVDEVDERVWSPAGLDVGAETPARRCSRARR